MIRRIFNKVKERKGDNAALEGEVYAAFKDTMLVEVPKLLPQELKNSNLKISDYDLCVVNNGYVLAEVSIKLIYKQYVNDNFHINTAAKKIATAIKTVLDLKNDDVREKIASQIKDNLFVTFLSEEQLDEDFKEFFPYRKWNDIYITYRYVVDAADQYFIESMLIDNEYMKYLGLSEEILYTTAMKNCSKLFSIIVKTSKEIARRPAPTKKVRISLDTVCKYEQVVVLPNTIISEITSPERNLLTKRLFWDLLVCQARNCSEDCYLVPIAKNEMLLMSRTVMKDRLLSFHFGNLLRVFMDEECSTETIRDYTLGTYCFKCDTFDLVPCTLDDMCALLVKN